MNNDIIEGGLEITIRKSETVEQSIYRCYLETQKIYCKDELFEAIIGMGYQIDMLQDFDLPHERFKDELHRMVGKVKEYINMYQVIYNSDFLKDKQKYFGDETDLIENE